MRWPGRMVASSLVALAANHGGRMGIKSRSRHTWGVILSLVSLGFPTDPLAHWNRLGFVLTEAHGGLETSPASLSSPCPPLSTLPAQALCSPLLQQPLFPSYEAGDEVDTGREPCARVQRGSCSVTAARVFLCTCCAIIGLGGEKERAGNVS